MAGRLKKLCPDCEGLARAVVSLRAEEVKSLAWNQADDGTAALTVRIVAGRTCVRLEVWSKRPGEYSRMVFTKAAPNQDTDATTLVTCAKLLPAYAAWLERNGWPGVG
jgi:hypothetical protein